MTLTIFYSWQSDLPNPTNRTFIENAIKAAIKKVGKEFDLTPAERDNKIKLDKDTSGIPGTPPIVDTIFKKIDACAVFVPDMTFVGKSEKGRLIPNPNVSVEYGWALKSLSYSHIAPVMNAYYGEADEKNLPFDMKHLRWPFSYTLSPDSTPKEKAEAKKLLVNYLAGQIKAIIESGLVNSEVIEPATHIPVPAGDEPSIFFDPAEPIGTYDDDFGGKDTDYRLPMGPKMFLRLYPVKPHDTLSAKEAIDISSQAGLEPMRRAFGTLGITMVRNKHGVVALGGNSESGIAVAVTQLFKNRELWGIDARMLNFEITGNSTSRGGAYIPCIAIEQVYTYTLTHYLKFAQEHLQLELPLHFVAGLTGVEGFKMSVGQGFFSGRMIEQNVIYEAEINDYDADVGELLLPFFRHVWEECGIERPENLT